MDGPGDHWTPVDDLLKFTFLVDCSWVPNRPLELLVGQSGGIWKPVLIAVAVKHILPTRTSNPLGEQEHQTLLKIYFGLCKSLVVSLQSKKNGAHFSGLKPACNNHHTRNSHALWLRNFMIFYGWDHAHSPIFRDGKEIVYHSSRQLRMEHINTSKQNVFQGLKPPILISGHQSAGISASKKVGLSRPHYHWPPGRWVATHRAAPREGNSWMSLSCLTQQLSMFTSLRGVEGRVEWILQPGASGIAGGGSAFFCH